MNRNSPKLFLTLLAILIATSCLFWFLRATRLKKNNRSNLISVPEVTPSLPNPLVDKVETNKSDLRHLVGMTLAEALSALEVDYAQCELKDEPPGILHIVRVRRISKLESADEVDLILYNSVLDMQRKWPFQMVMNVKIEEVIVH